MRMCQLCIKDTLKGHQYVSIFHLEMKTKQYLTGLVYPSESKFEFSTVSSALLWFEVTALSSVTYLLCVPVSVAVTCAYVCVRCLCVCVCLMFVVIVLTKVFSLYLLNSARNNMRKE